MSSVELARAALEVAELEAELVSAKADGDVDRDLKDRLREARRVQRTLREGGEL